MPFRSNQRQNFDSLRAELTARGRDVTAERLEGYDHAFRKPGSSTDTSNGMQDVLGRAAAWFLEKSEPLADAVRDEQKRLVGLTTLAATASRRW